MPQKPKIADQYRALLKSLAPYQRPDLKRSLWQITNSFLPYFALWYLMILSLEISYWLTLVLAIPAAGFLVRIFIIFHDCGHGSYFKSRRARNFVGYIAGVLTFTPYLRWWHEHAVHHASAGNLDHRGHGDVWTLTVKEYQTRSKWQKLGYRLFRHPLVMFTIGPLFVFLVQHRYPKKDSGAQARKGTYLTDTGILVIILAMSLTIGIKAYILIQLPVFIFSASAGVWLFYVQHQFDGVYWERDGNWDFIKAGIEGSSFYKLPSVLQWFSGNIGFHHIHHLNSRIPNYFLEKCHHEVPAFQTVKPITLAESLKTLKYRLWDEDRQHLISFRQLKALQAA